MKCFRASKVTDDWKIVEVFDDGCSAGRRIICAFCFNTSAGVKMKQETSSAIADAALWMNGSGTKGRDDGSSIGFAFLNKDFTLSYVVKNALAVEVRFHDQRNL